MALEEADIILTETSKGIGPPKENNGNLFNKIQSLKNYLIGLLYLNAREMDLPGNHVLGYLGQNGDKLENFHLLKRISQTKYS